jgi:aspartyl-tRNA(Asn)/glutamyl-tRNA(Gln) amidotransferase subunit A
MTRSPSTPKAVIRAAEAADLSIQPHDVAAVVQTLRDHDALVQPLLDTVATPEAPEGAFSPSWQGGRMPVAVESIAGSRVLARYDATEPLVHAFTEFDRAAAASLGQPDRHGALGGLSFAVKDVFAVAGTVTRCGCAALKDNYTAVDSEVVARLRSAGAVLVGKLVTHELTCGLDDPGTRNPWNVDTYPGGSSAGAGAAVAVGVCDFAIGTDAAGSVRIPAAATHTVGLKPTYGLLSTEGLQRFATAPSIDHVGIIARSVETVEDVFEVLAGSPSHDTDLGNGQLHGVRLGSPKWASAQDTVTPEVDACHQRALGVLRDLGAELVDVAIPEFELVPAVVFTLFPAELASAHRELLRSAQSYHPDVRHLLQAGALIPEDHVQAARAYRLALRDVVAAAYDRYRLDALVTPTMPMPPPLLAELVPTRDLGPLTTLTAPFNVTGQPALTVPSGFVNGLPVGLQLAGRPFEESRILTIGREYLNAASQTPPNRLSSRTIQERLP